MSAKIVITETSDGCYLKANNQLKSFGHIRRILITALISIVQESVSIETIPTEKIDQLRSYLNRIANDSITQSNGVFVSNNDPPSEVRRLLLWTLLQIEDDEEALAKVKSTKLLGT